MPISQFEVITTTDKAERDRLFVELRTNGNRLERQVVKWSSNERVYVEDGKPDVRWQHYRLTGHVGQGQYRQVYRSTWSVAYPKQ